MKRPLRAVEVFGSAKVNIGWRVGPQRKDGYHEVCGLMQTISLTDRLEIRTGEGSAPIELRVPGHPELEADDNLVRAAATAIADHADPVPTTVIVHKSIPVAAGLGGGSADAAAALVGLNAVWRAGRTARQLADLAGKIGSDVPPILAGGLVHASGRGERVRGVGGFTDGWLVLGVGAEHVAAADVYARFDALGPRHDDALYHNDLEPAACELVPGLADRIDAMREAAGVAFVSGSGPTVVGVVTDERSGWDVADRVRSAFTDVVVAQPVDWGVRMVAGS